MNEMNSNDSTMNKLSSLMFIVSLALGIPLIAHAEQTSDAENVLWEEVQKGNSVDDYQVYITEYPKGKYVALARSRSKKLFAESANDAIRKDKDAWQAANLAGGEADYQGYLRDFPQGKFSGLAQDRIGKLHAGQVARDEQMLWQKAQGAENSQTVQSYLDNYPNGSHAAAAQEKLAALRKAESEMKPTRAAVKPELFISNKTRSEMQQSLGLFPEAASGKMVTLKVMGNIHMNSYDHNTQGYDLKIQNKDGICYWEMSTGATGAYFGAGILPAVVSSGMFVIGHNAMTSKQEFSGSIATMTEGETLDVKLVGRGLPGETEVTVMDTKPDWPEFNFPYAGTRLRIIRDYETAQGYLKGDQIAIYSPEIGCAVPVSHEVVEISGNRLFGDKQNLSEKSLSAVLDVK
jgi:hypothetical protein